MCHPYKMLKCTPKSRKKERVDFRAKLPCRGLFLRVFTAIMPPDTFCIYPHFTHFIITKILIFRENRRIIFIGFPAANMLIYGQLIHFSCIKDCISSHMIYYLPRIPKCGKTCPLPKTKAAHNTPLLPLFTALFLTAVTAARTRFARFARAIVAALTVGTFTVWIVAASVLYHRVSPPFTWRSF